MDLAYYSYLAQTIPPREIARALIVRARQKLLRGKPFFFEVPELQRRRERLYAHLERRPTVFDAAQLAGMSPDAILREAEAARRGELLLFNQLKSCGAPIDYHRDPFVPQVRYDASVPGETVELFEKGADAKAMWEAGRLPQLWRFGQAYRLTGDASWARAWEETVRHFAAVNPVGLGVQWACPMEVSLRAMNVALTFGLVQGAVDPAFLLDFLEEHCVYVAGHLEETGAIRTNHYAADLVGLVVTGALFTELRRWHDVFARRLWEEISRQCRADGTHFESSTGYQRVCAETFLAAVLAVRAGELPVPIEVEQAVRGLFVSLASTLKPSGRIPQVGDFDSSRSLPLAPRAPLDVSYFADASAPEWGWLPAARAFLGDRPEGSTVLRDAGIAVLRSGDAWLCLSAGPNGQGGTGGHAHNDKCSVELSVGSFDILVDRGTYVYARDPQERNARRGTAGHSTVQVDGLEQNRIVPGRLFALPDTARARVGRLQQRGGFNIAAGEHRGYARAGILHRRIAALRADCAAFVDELRGHGEHLFTARWFTPHPDVVQRPATDEEKARLLELHGAGLSFGYDLQRCLVVGGRALFAFGASLPWKLQITATDVSPGYAEKMPARCITLEAAGAAPARLFTAVLFLRTP
jgi:heparinase II/III-like protein